jgi:NADPH:quinone reductase-like Zn-dependent oxidoreductase
VPAAREVLIRVKAASVNPVDWKIRRGMLRRELGDKFPIPLGRECSGDVSAFGNEVKRFRKGDQVIASLTVVRLGSFAEYVAVPDSSVYQKPKNISYEQAATVPVAGLTALRALRDAGRIENGMSVAVIGASGGVGHYAIQIARIFGAEVTAISRDGHGDFVLRLGAARVIDYVREDFTLRGERYDIIFDAVGKRSFTACKKALTANGVYITTLGNKGPFSEGGRRATEVSGIPSQEDMQWMKERIEEGRIKIAVLKVYPLDQVKDALAESESEHATGKLVLNAA